MRTQPPANILGIDIGSVCVSVVEMTPDKEIVKTAYEFHHGNLIENLGKILNSFDLTGICAIASTASTPSIIQTNRRCDNRIAVITAARFFHEKIGAILIVGGERFGLMQFDDHGNYLHFISNTSCAAGTGSFLDQQAQRLNLKGIAELSEIASRNRAVIPKIATRCAVFAKTDLAHAQQEGYSLEQICDGLCHGLARNIVDTLMKRESPGPPLLFTGGVSRNQAVARHLESLIGLEVLVHEHAHLYGAIGAGLNLIEEGQPITTISINSDIARVFVAKRQRCPWIQGVVTEGTAGDLEKSLRRPSERNAVDIGICTTAAGDSCIMRVHTTADLLVHRPPETRHTHEPLDLTLRDYPDFQSVEHYEFLGFEPEDLHPVEVEIYEELMPSKTYEVYLGIDIGSTSTKAVLLGRNKTVLAGFYTRTAGRPVQAVRKLFASVDDLMGKRGFDLKIIGTGTTGAGRKFSGKIIGADRVVDEITAHARAAVELHPDVDTIIEIGGQDSKFTTLRKGTVTFSVMNNVCAAGTGSFIEEQAQKLHCSLSDYSSRVGNKRAPMTSDRCTVFMERDINHYLSEGYSVDEVLASVLHAIRENYLTKVAVQGSIGNTICFQGATAKNKALVAAFEQGLQKPIHVSRYCHLTGALGVAHILSDEGVTGGEFRGIGLYRKPIPVSSEVCELCTNHCKISVADMDGEEVAYGFLCGRDYDVQKFVNNNRSGFDLLHERKKIFSVEPAEKYGEPFTIGLPAALHLHEDLPLWKKFFEELSIRTVTSEAYSDALKEGKRSGGAEFCAPINALHGHVSYLLGRADYVFLPFYLEKRSGEKSVRRQFCYYTQFSSSLVSHIHSGEERRRILTPLVHYLYPPLHAKAQLFKMLKPLLTNSKSLLDIPAAYDRAIAFKNAGSLKLREIYKREAKKSDDLQVVFVGRPYAVLSPSMNSGIPGIFASQGIKTFFQDMLSYTSEDVAPVEPLCRELPWHYASEIMQAAEAVARTQGTYPVLITSFKCTPDSFVLEYFKQLMEFHEKPYLVLQLDEHASSVGYETRIEAAIRTFRNHHASHSPGRSRRTVTYGPSLIPTRERDLADKTLLIPNWDNLTLNLMVANLRSAGIDARLLKETGTSIQKSLRHNTGQCIPMNIIAQEFMDYVEKHDLDPAKTVLWMMNATVPCNLGMFPHHIKNIFQSYGNGLSRAGVYTGSYSFVDLSMKLPINTYFAYMFGGLIRKMGCRTRPHEKTKGETDEIIQESMKILENTFLINGCKETAVAKAVSLFAGIETDYKPRPKVAIIGDLYVRDNEVMNQGLMHFIEANGGEVITTPYSSYAKMISQQYIRKWFFEGYYLGALSTKTLVATVTRLEKVYYKYFERILREPEPKYDESPEKILSRYNIRVENTGESMDNILKIFYIKKHYPDVSLFVQTNPAFCCPSLVTEAMAKEIEKNTGTPIVSITYDGTEGNKNDILVPYLRLNY